MFKRSIKKNNKLKIMLEGASGSGKTLSALFIAETLGKKIAVIDTEQGSAGLYSDKVPHDICELRPPFTPESYIKAIKAAEVAGYDVLIIDSITHEWSGQGGCLDLHTQLGGRFQDWAKVTPRHKQFIDTILQCPMHVITTARAKSDYEVSQDSGKVRVQKVGLKTEQRDGLDYEFTLVFRLNQNHVATATKDRTGMFDNIDEVITQQTGERLLSWLNTCKHIETINQEQAAKLKEMLGDSIKAFLAEHGFERLGQIPFTLYEEVIKG